jgi:hypothetical protein
MLKTLDKDPTIPNKDVPMIKFRQESFFQSEMSPFITPIFLVSSFTEVFSK